MLYNQAGFSGANGTGRGGGDPITEFQEIGKQIHQSIKDIPLYRDHFKIPMDDFLEKVKTATVRTTFEPIIIEDENKTASNNYSDDILVYVQGWNSIHNPIIKKRLVFHEYLSLLKLEWNNFYLISNTLYNEQFIAPLPVDFGIYQKLDSDMNYYALVLRRSSSNKEVSKNSLEVLYQYTIEDLLNVFKILIEKPSLLEKNSFIRKIQKILMDHTNALKKYDDNFVMLNNNNYVSIDQKLHFSRVKLRHIQAYSLVWKVKEFIEQSKVYKNYLDNKSGNNLKEYSDKMKLLSVQYKKSYTTFIEDELDHLESIERSNNLTRRQRSQLNSLSHLFIFVLYNL